MKLQYLGAAVEVPPMKRPNVFTNVEKENTL